MAFAFKLKIEQIRNIKAPVPDFLFLISYLII